MFFGSMGRWSGGFSSAAQPVLCVFCYISHSPDGVGGGSGWVEGEEEE